MPHPLIGHVALAAEHEAALNEEVDDLADDHSNHVGGEVGHAALVRTVADDVPLEGDAEQGHINAREAEVPVAQVGKGSGQEGQKQVFKDRDEIADDDEQAALPDPFGCGGVLFCEAAPKGSYFIHVPVPPAV